MKKLDDDNHKPRRLTDDDVDHIRVILLRALDRHDAIQAGSCNPSNDTAESSATAA